MKQINKQLKQTFPVFITLKQNDTHIEEFYNIIVNVQGEGKFIS